MYGIVYMRRRRHRQKAGARNRGEVKLRPWRLRREGEEGEEDADCGVGPDCQLQRTSKRESDAGRERMTGGSRAHVSG